MSKSSTSTPNTSKLYYFKERTFSLSNQAQVCLPRIMPSTILLHVVLRLEPQTFHVLKQTIIKDSQQAEYNINTTALMHSQRNDKHKILKHNFQQVDLGGIFLYRLILKYLFLVSPPHFIHTKGLYTHTLNYHTIGTDAEQCEICKNDY